MTDRTSPSDSSREADEQMFEQIFNAATNAMAFTETAEGRIVDVNRAWCRATGVSREAAIGRTALSLGLWMSEDERTACRATLASVGHLADYEAGLRFVDGDRTVLMSAGVIHMRGSAHVLWEFRDVSDQRRAEAERERLRTELAHAQKMESIGTLAGGIAHDFNNILGSIILQLEMLQDEQALPQPVEQGLSEVRAAADRAASLTQQLLLFSRKRPMCVETFDLNEVVIRHAHMLQRIIGERFHVAITPTAEPVWISGDPTMIEQIIMNLCVNARDAMPDGGTLTVALEVASVTPTAPGNTEARRGKFAVIRVSDSGIGMDAMTRDRIFEPFFTTKPIGSGTGLGLSTADGIVTQHYGWMHVASEPGAGSTFSVFLPVAVAPTAADTTSAVLPAPRKNATILLVDDERTIRSMTRRALQRLGYRVVEAESGDHALAIWEQESQVIDVVVTDVVMPGRTSGVTLRDQLRRSRPAVPIVLTTGYSADLVNMEFQPSTCDALLCKPFSIAQLDRELHRVLGE